MGAELPMTVAVDGELLPAGRAGKGVDCLPLHQLHMCVPPLVPACIGTKAFPLPSRILNNGPATLLAKGICRRCNQAVPPTKKISLY